MSTAAYQIKGVARATCTLAVAATFNEIGVEYELIDVDMMKGEHKSAEYLDKFQPFGQIPVLIEGDFQMFESRAIIRYIAAKHGAESVYPSDFKKRAIVENWLSVQQSNNGPAIDIIGEFTFKFLRGGTPDESRVPELTEKLNAYLAILDKQLSKHAFIAGEEYTLADISFIPYFHYVLAAAPFVHAFDSFPNLKRWWQAVSTRPSWVKSLPKQ